MTLYYFPLDIEHHPLPHAKQYCCIISVNFTPRQTCAMLVIDENKFTIQILLLAPPFHSCTVHSLNDAFNVKCHKSCSLLLGKSKLVEKAANVQLRMIKYVNYVIMWICSCKWSEMGTSCFFSSYFSFFQLF